MAVDKNRLVPIGTIQSDYRAELEQFIDEFNALQAGYVVLIYATQAQVDAGASTNVAVSPATLRTHLENVRFSAGDVSIGSADAGRAPRLDRDGQLHPTFMQKAVIYATQAQVDAGLATDRGISPLTLDQHLERLRFSASTISLGPADAGKAPILNASGKIDNSFINVVPASYIGPFNASVSGGGYAPADIVNGSSDYENGNYLICQTAGQYDFATGATGSGQQVVPTDYVIYDGTSWDVIPNPVNVTNFLLRDGTNQMEGPLDFDPTGDVSGDPWQVKNGWINGGAY